MATGLIYSPRYKDHLTGPGHPESPKRLDAVMDHLRDSRIWPLVKEIVPHPAEPKIVHLVHPASHLSSVERACARGVSVLDQGDTVVCRDSYSVALLAVGGVVEGVRQIFEKHIQNAFCVVRPPGHHAELNLAMGFCLFNHAAIAAKYAQKLYRVERVLVLDWDVHHGNGTQHIFESDPSVFYISLHQYPFYPGTGGASETGTGDGLGTTKNFPFPAGTGDREYMDVFANVIPGIVREFSPEFIILSSGFDAHTRDPLANVNLTTESFLRMTEIAVRLASEICDGRLLSILEGGYHLKALRDCVLVHVSALMSSSDKEG